MLRIVILLTFGFLVGCSSSKMTVTTVEDVDIERYMGTWYEIARFPHRFERDLVGVTATYSLRKDGKVDVLNKGYKYTLDGKKKSASAFAKVPNPDELGKLKVYFFWPFGGDYYILNLDTLDYQWSLVGSSSPNFLWILSRTPQMDDELLGKLTNYAQGLGYDTSQLELVEQPPASE